MVGAGVRGPCKQQTITPQRRSTQIGSAIPLDVAALQGAFRATRENWLLGVGFRRDRVERKYAGERNHYRQRGGIHCVHMIVEAVQL